MGIETKTKAIDGLDCATTQFPAMRSVALLSRLGNGGGTLSETLIADLLQSTEVIVRDEGKDARRVDLTSAIAIDSVFNGRAHSLLNVVNWVIEVNFSSFGQGPTALASGAVPAPAANP